MQLQGKVGRLENNQVDAKRGTETEGALPCVYECLHTYMHISTHRQIHTFGCNAHCPLSPR